MVSQKFGIEFLPLSQCQSMSLRKPSVMHLLITKQRFQLTWHKRLTWNGKRFQRNSRRIFMYKKMFQVSLVIALVALANFIKFLVSKDSGGAYEGPISIVLMFFPPLVAGMLYSMDDNEKRYIRAKDIYFS